MKPRTIVFPAAECLSLRYGPLPHFVVGILKFRCPSDNESSGSGVVFAITRMPKPFDVGGTAYLGPFGGVVVELGEASQGQRQGQAW